VTLGGAVAIFGPKRVLDPDIGWGFSLQEQAGQSQTINAHLVRYIVNFRTTERSIIASDPHVGPRRRACVVPGERRRDCTGPALDATDRP
jgi:hypothetical protein